MHILKWAASILLLGLGVYFIDLTTITDSLQSISATAFILATGLNFIGLVFLPALLTKRLHQGEYLDLSLIDLVKINLSMRFYTLVLPRIVTLPIQWSKYRQKGSSEHSLAILIIERVVQLLVFIGFALLSLSMLDEKHPDLSTATTSTAAYLLAILFLSGIGVRYFSNRIGTSTAVSSESKYLHRFRTALLTYKSLPAPELGTIFLISSLSYCFLVGGAYLLSLELNMSISVLELSTVYSSVFLITLFPFSAGGIGLRELSFVALLSLYQIPEEIAFSLGLATTASFIVLALIGLIQESLTWAYRKQ